MDSCKCSVTSCPGGLSALGYVFAESCSCSGYVALAVVGENDTLSRDLNTGLGGDRPANMVAFAVEALKLVEEFIGKVGSSSGKM